MKIVYVTVKGITLLLGGNLIINRIAMTITFSLSSGRHVGSSVSAVTGLNLRLPAPISFRKSVRCHQSPDSEWNLNSGSSARLHFRPGKRFDSMCQQLACKLAICHSGLFSSDKKYKEFRV